MSIPLEADVESAVCQIAQEHGWLARKVRWVGRRGAADRVFFGHGRCVWIEFKRPETGRESELQRRELRRLREHYPEVHVAYTAEYALQKLGITVIE